MSLNTTMRGVLYEGTPNQVRVADLPMPTLQAGSDAIVRITTSAICGSDLHMYHGLQGGDEPWGMGHEAIGYISEIGNAVSSLAVGDYVVIPDNPSSGHLDMESPVLGIGYGISDGIGGLQAEYARVPFADETLIPVPLAHNTTNSTIEQAYLTTADIFATAWQAVSWSEFEAGDTVAVFGAGPVGLLAAYSAILRGASRVYSVDREPMRLERAASIGAVPINFNESDAVQQILAYEPDGVIRAVDCVGEEAVNAAGEPDQGIVLRNMVAVAGNQGGIGQIGVYMAQNATAAAPNAGDISPEVGFPLTDFFSKSLSYRAGVVDPKEVAPELVRLIASGKARPQFIESAVIGIEDVPEYYERFDRREELKVYVRFP